MSVHDQLQQAYQFIRAGSRQEAVQILMPILRANPGNADAWWLLANAVTDPNQKKRALEEVLKLRPGDERARKMLDQVAPPPPPSNSFDMDDSMFNPPPAAAPMAAADPMPNWASSSDTQASVSPVGPDPFASAPKAPSSAPVAYSQPPPAAGYPPGNVPPAPVYMGPPKKKGPSCCLIFSCLFILLICVAPTLCVGAGFAGLSPVFNELAITLGAPNFQSLPSLLSGQATPLPGSALDEAFDQLGIENIGQLQGTFEGMATLAGTPGLVETFEATFPRPVVGEPMPGTPVNRGTIEVGQSVTGTLSTGSVGDAWIINLSDGQTIVIDAEGGTGTDTTLTVVNSANIVQAFDDDGGDVMNSRLTFTPDSAGKYTIVVGTFASQAGSYTLTVQEG